ncbi:MAG: hypothetical protein ACMXYM_05755 [Candidatus Woesearchaeota archaeon]
MDSYPSRATDTLTHRGFEHAHTTGWHVYVHHGGDGALIKPESNEAHYLSGDDPVETRKDLTTIIGILERAQATTTFNPRESAVAFGAGSLIGLTLTRDLYLTLLGGTLGALAYETAARIRTYRTRRELKRYTGLVRGHEAWERILN